MVDLDADPETLGEGVRADGHDHELLQVDRVLRVRAAVDHVQHRHRQRHGVDPAEVAVERQPGLAPRPPSRRRARRRGSRSRRDGPCSASRRARSAAASSASCSAASRPTTAFASSPFAFATACVTPLPPYSVAAVAQLDRLVHAGRRAGRDGRAPAARPTRAATSTSTVGLPRESRTCRAWTRAIALTPPPSHGRSSGPARRAPARSTPRRRLRRAAPPPRRARRSARSRGAARARGRRSADARR